jgi:transcriptional regulator with GAF, ATPase, and Fis domain
LARQIHRWSSRAKEPFVTVSCPSLSRDLLESELFGHMKGAFTGAVATTWGKVAAADRGTLFLDEIGELPLEIQPKLLRLLQEREYERLGESKMRMSKSQGRRGAWRFPGGPSLSSRCDFALAAAVARTAGRHPGPG